MNPNLKPKLPVIIFDSSSGYVSGITHVLGQWRVVYGMQNAAKRFRNARGAQHFIDTWNDMAPSFDGSKCRIEPVDEVWNPRAAEPAHISTARFCEVLGLTPKVTP